MRTAPPPIVSKFCVRCGGPRPWLMRPLRCTGCETREIDQPPAEKVDDEALNLLESHD